MINENLPFSARVNNFNSRLGFDAPLPKNIEVLNPFKDPGAFETASAFYNKFYNICKW